MITLWMWLRSRPSRPRRLHRRADLRVDAPGRSCSRAARPGHAISVLARASRPLRMRLLTIGRDAHRSPDRLPGPVEPWPTRGSAAPRTDSARLPRPPGLAVDPFRTPRSNLPRPADRPRSRTADRWPTVAARSIVHAGTTPSASLTAPTGRRGSRGSRPCYLPGVVIVRGPRPELRSLLTRGRRSVRSTGTRRAERDAEFSNPFAVLWVLDGP